MSSSPQKKPAAAPKPAASASGSPAPAAAPKAPRKPRVPAMPLLVKLDMLTAVRSADPTMPDAALAESLTATFGREVIAAGVKRWRGELGLASVPRKTAVQLELELLEARGRIAHLESQIAHPE